MLWFSCPQAITTIGAFFLICSLLARFVVHPMLKFGRHYFLHIINEPWSSLIPKRGAIFEVLYNAHLFVNALLIVGGTLNLASLFLPWLILNGLFVLLFILITLSYTKRSNIDGLALALIVTVLHSFCWYLVKSYHSTMGRDQGGEECV